MKPMLLPPHVGCFSVAPLPPQPVQSARWRSTSLDAVGPQLAPANQIGENRRRLCWADWAASKEKGAGSKPHARRKARSRSAWQRLVERTDHAMTINVALVTTEAFVLGCDSTASTGEYYLDPFHIGVEKDAAGKIIYDADGRATVKFKFEQVEHIITDAWGGVTKMFLLCSKVCQVAAITSGPASLGGRTISSLASDYCAKPKAPGVKRAPKSVKEVAAGFLEFLRVEYLEHYKRSTLPDFAKDGPELLVGGFGKGDKFPSCYRLRVKENDVKEEFAGGDCGITWNAQSDAVEQIIRGYDTKLRYDIEEFFGDAIKAYQGEMNQAVLHIVDEVLKKLNISMPQGINTTVPSPASLKPPWEKFKVGVPYSALPLQEAINFVSYLVLTQVGKSRFARGVATVGGRTHIGLITKDKGYKQLNEPELAHYYTGFAE